MTSAIIVAAGGGVRMGPNVDKLFLEVAGRPVVAHTWQRFDGLRSFHEIILVIRKGMQGSFVRLAEQFQFRKRFQLVEGGKERQDSVWNGLNAMDARSEMVAIQDGARPCVAAAVIEATVEAAREVGAAVAARRVTDTIKESSDGLVVGRTVDRSRLWAVQTPQTFRVEVIRRALGAVREKNLIVTDDASACEYIGQAVRLVEDNSPNPKVTIPGDVAYVDLLLRNSEAGH